MTQMRQSPELVARTEHGGGWRGLAARMLLPPRRDGGLAADTFWNAASNCAGASLSFVIMILASRRAGAYWCGVASLAIAMSQQFFNIGSFSTGGYQASDIAERHSFSEYVVAKSISVAAMLAAAAAWLAAARPGRSQTLAFLAMTAYQASEAFSGVFFSRYQQKGRLDASCRIRVAKSAAFALVYGVAIMRTGDTILSLFAAAAAHIALFVVLDLPLLPLFGPLRPKPQWRGAFAILSACSPLALNAFLLVFIHNGPRLAVNTLLGEEAFAKYSALFMVAFALAMCSDFLMNPQVVRLAEAARGRDHRRFARLLAFPFAATAAMWAIGLASAKHMGIPLLSLLFKIDLSGFDGVLRAILCGGGVLALFMIAQAVLVVLRRQAWTLPGLTLATAFVALQSKALVAGRGLNGAAAAYALACALLAAPTVVAASICSIRAFRRRE